MGSDRIRRAEGKKSSSLVPKSKPKQFSFLQPRYQDRVETDSVQDNKQLNPTAALSHSFGRMSVLPIQAKLKIGEPNDKYEQEADRVASQVIQQINVPSTAQLTQGQLVQRMDEPEEEELQTKPQISPIQRSLISPVVQRMNMPEEEELQTKSILQRREAVAGGEASMGLTSAINNARGGGQPLDAGLQESIGQAMGADFSEVRVHTDAKSDQLNQSIQARAFTTGHDLFFRHGAYQPGSRRGKESIAHELTHVVQQNERALMNQSSLHITKPSFPQNKTKIQRVIKSDKSPSEYAEGWFWWDTEDQDFNLYFVTNKSDIGDKSRSQWIDGYPPAEDSSTNQMASQPPASSSTHAAPFIGPEPPPASSSTSQARRIYGPEPPPASSSTSQARRNTSNLHDETPKLRQAALRWLGNHPTHPQKQYVEPFARGEQLRKGRHGPNGHVTTQSGAHIFFNREGTRVVEVLWPGASRAGGGAVLSPHKRRGY